VKIIKLLPIPCFVKSFQPIHEVLVFRYFRISNCYFEVQSVFPMINDNFSVLEALRMNILIKIQQLKIIFMKFRLFHFLSKKMKKSLLHHYNLMDKTRYGFLYNISVQDLRVISLPVKQVLVSKIYM